jgi:hypothetical protein
MPMTALPVKKKPTIAGRTCTSLVKNRLRVGVCNAPAMPVRKATIRKAEEVKSNPRRGRAALLFCMSVICHCLSSGVYAVTQKMNSSMARKLKSSFKLVISAKS